MPLAHEDYGTTPPKQEKLWIARRHKDTNLKREVALTLLFLASNQAQQLDVVHNPYSLLSAERANRLFIKVAVECAEDVSLAGHGSVNDGIIIYISQNNWTARERRDYLG